jgi:hypothetical protein
MLAAQPAPQTVQLAAGAAADVRWTVQVPDGATRIDWEGSAVEVGGNAPAQDRLTEGKRHGLQSAPRTRCLPWGTR